MAESSEERPCGACPWVSQDPRDKEAINAPGTQEAMKAGTWFCCHVNMGTCHGAALQYERHQRLFKTADG